MEKAATCTHPTYADVDGFCTNCGLGPDEKAQAAKLAAKAQVTVWANKLIHTGGMVGVGSVRHMGHHTRNAEL